MHKSNRLTHLVWGTLLAFAFTAMASYNIKLDQSLISFYTANDFANGVEVTGLNNG